MMINLSVMMEIFDRVTWYPYGYKHWENMKNKIVEMKND